jgi:glycosyltransferase involved in cell wall biosynthesis
MRIALVCSPSAARVDGIRDYTSRLADALALFDGVTAETVGQHALDTSPEHFDAIVVQYNPFMYGRWGFAPELPLRLFHVRRRRGRPRIVLMVHEPFVPMINWRWALMGLWQRSQLRALHAVADVIFASIESWTEMLARWRPHRPTHHLPVGSNLPDMRAARSKARQRHGATGDTVVLAAFGTAHPGRHLNYIVQAANNVAAGGATVVLQNLGADVPALDELDPRVRLSQPGYQEPIALARQLAASDVFLAPFIDGVSTRRTTVMAALQHGIATVATDGPLTDGLLRRSTSAIRLVPTLRRDLFIEATVRLALQNEDREAVGRAGRQLYEERFDWSGIASQLIACVRPRNRPEDR